jgi:inorganic pyrophosphatase
MPNLAKLAPQDKAGAWLVVVESPRGATVKLAYDPEKDVFQVKRPLPLGLHYPFDWGFLPSTEGPDGDPLDVLVLWEGTSAPGSVVPCRLVGVIELEQNGERGRERNDRILAVPTVSARDELEDATRLPQRTCDELAQFFVAAARLEGKEPRVLGVRGARAAHALVQRSMPRKRRRAA